MLSLAALLAFIPPAYAGGKTGATIDAWISGAQQRVGDGAFSRSADGETLATTVMAPDTLTFVVGATVSGGITSVRFVGGGGSPDFQVRYLASDGADITLAVTGRGYVVRKVHAGETVTIRMVVAVKASAAGHSGNLAVLAGGDMVAAFITAQ